MRDPSKCWIFFFLFYFSGDGDNLAADICFLLCITGNRVGLHGYTNGFLLQCTNVTRYHLHGRKSIGVGFRKIWAQMPASPLTTCSQRILAEKRAHFPTDFILSYKKKDATQCTFTELPLSLSYSSDQGANQMGKNSFSRGILIIERTEDKTNK